MTTEILIVSYARDFRYLKYCLRSISKFCKDFEGVTLVLPEKDVPASEGMIDEWLTANGDISFPITTKVGQEWERKGMLWHMFVVCSAETWVFGEPDLILHVDSDFVFTEPVTPETFLHEGKPILPYASFDWVCRVGDPNTRHWQLATEAALGWKPENEFMRHPHLIHIRDVYEKTRLCIEDHNAMICCDYIRAQRNEFPQSFAEFPTIGEVAWKFFHDRYHWINQETEPMPKRVIYQAWSHREPTAEDMAKYKELGLL